MVLGVAGTLPHTRPRRLPGEPSGGGMPRPMRRAALEPPAGAPDVGGSSRQTSEVASTGGPGGTTSGPGRGPRRAIAPATADLMARIRARPRGRTC
ncbi:hypothetical protein QJS66_03860 [Kocuria rhizophila]|nr:hypothetical protein QJS66_03860 [Kocuria rhizophila]